MGNYPPGVMLPNARERRQIFYWLKRISSYSAWRRILEYYRSWVSITEKSVSVANDRGWLRLYEEGKIVGGVPTGRKISDGKGGQYAQYTGSALGESSLIRILKGFAHAEEGVRRLRLGDKRVFQYNAHGEFVMADGAPSYWVTLIDRIEIGENTIDQDHTPHWDEFCFALTQLSEAWGESSPFLIEPQDLNAPSQTIYGDYLRERLPKMSYPNELPEVPDAKELTLVATGKSVPCSGIWEPVYVAKPKGFYLFSAQPSPEGPLPIVGCMSYLHAGSAAPRARQETEKESLRNDVTWRLLWRDDRYEDGTIPEEERGYVFQQPDPARLAPEPEELRGGMRVWSDEPCPYPGVWKCLDDLTLSPQTVAFGIPMPRRRGRRVMWRFMKAV